MEKKRYSEDSDALCQHATKYELNHALVKLIQKTTGESTHVIMNNIIAETNKMFKELDIDPNSKKAGAIWSKGWGKNSSHYWSTSYKRRNKLITYANTDISFNLIVNIHWCEDNSTYVRNPNGTYGRTDGPHNINEVTIKVTLPNKTLKYSTSDMSMLLAEGDILDESSDLDELDIKQSKPPRKKKTKTDTTKVQEIGEES
jgi:hypothetical protein